MPEFVLPAIVIILIVLFGFQIVESDCQAKHNVADCEWSRTPFTPVIPEVK